MDSLQVFNPELVALLKTHFERCWSCGVDTWDPADMPNDGDVTSTSIQVPGARLGDPAVASHTQIAMQDILITAHVEAAGWVRVILMNKTGAGVNLVSGTLTACVRVRYGI